MPTVIIRATACTAATAPALPYDTYSSWRGGKPPASPTLSPVSTTATQTTKPAQSHHHSFFNHFHLHFPSSLSRPSSSHSRSRSHSPSTSPSPSTPSSPTLGNKARSGKHRPPQLRLPSPRPSTASNPSKSALSISYPQLSSCSLASPAFSFCPTGSMNSAHSGIDGEGDERRDGEWPVGWGVRSSYAESERGEEGWDRDGDGSSVEAVESGFENHRELSGLEDDRIDFVVSGQSVDDASRRMESRWSLNSESVGDGDGDEGCEEEESVLERLEAFEFEPEDRFMRKGNGGLEEREEVFVGFAL